MKQPQNRQTKYNIQQKTIRKAAVDVKNTVYKRHGGNDAYTPKDSGALPKQHALPLPQEDVYGKPLPQKNRQNGKYRLQPQGKVAPEIEKDQHKPNADKQCAEHGEYDADAVVRALLIRADMPALKAVPGVGQARAAVIMEAAGVAPNRRLAGVGSRQVAQLTQQVDQRSTATAVTQQTEVV